MSSKEIDRKIAVIFATDVVGYSKLMENDEDHTIKAIRVCKEILETLFKEHGGRTFNTERRMIYGIMEEHLSMKIMILQIFIEIK